MFKRTVSVIAIVIAALCTLYFFYIQRNLQFSTGPFPMSWTIVGPKEDTAFGGLFYKPYISDSLPYYRYKHIQDSIQQIQDAIKLNNKGFGSSMGVGGISVQDITEYKPFAWETNAKNDPALKELEDSVDLLNKKMASLAEGDSLRAMKKLSDEVRWRNNVRSHELHRQKQESAPKQYYLGLAGYTIRDQNTQFFLDKNGYNLVYVVWDSVQKRTYDSTMYGHYERKSIPVRYVADENKVLIPLSKQQHRYATLGLEWGSYLLLFLCIYFSIGIPLQIVWNISRGRAFTLKNVQRFRLIAYALLAYGIAGTTIPYLLRFFFRDLIPGEFVFTPFTQNLLNQLPLFIGAVGVYLVGQAFRRGYNLQQDNALTI